MELLNKGRDILGLKERTMGIGDGALRRASTRGRKDDYNPSTTLALSLSLSFMFFFLLLRYFRLFV